MVDKYEGLETAHKMEDTSKDASIQGMNFSSTAEWELDERGCRVASIYEEWLDKVPDHNNFNYDIC